MCPQLLVKSRNFFNGVKPRVDQKQAPLLQKNATTSSWMSRYLIAEGGGEGSRLRGGHRYLIAEGGGEGSRLRGGHPPPGTPRPQLRQRSGR